MYNLPNNDILKNTLPHHIGIMMDGNRRWAKKRGLPAALGHKKGAEIFKQRAYDLAEIGVKNATFFAFSTENLNRRAEEVAGLMRLFEEELSELKKTADNNIKLLFIGDLSIFSDKLQTLAREAESYSENNTGLICRLALNYGGRAEIIRAVKSIKTSEISELTEAKFGEALYTGASPDVDFIIRTGGEKRLSNFLLWQAAYAELYFTDTLWCDFDKKELEIALNEYSSRNRRFGN